MHYILGVQLVCQLQNRYTLLHNLDRRSHYNINGMTERQQEPKVPVMKPAALAKFSDIILSEANNWDKIRTSFNGDFHKSFALGKYKLHGSRLC
jgi:hypothetical protein